MSRLVTPEKYTRYTPGQVPNSDFFLRTLSPATGAAGALLVGSWVADAGRLRRLVAFQFMHGAHSERLADRARRPATMLLQVLLAPVVPAPNSGASLC